MLFRVLFIDIQHCKIFLYKYATHIAKIIYCAKTDYTVNGGAATFFSSLIIAEGSGNNKDNSFLSNFNNLYDYLDNLSLMQESAIYHILVFLSLIFIIFNILGILFGNEIINYFNLEKNYHHYIFFLNYGLNLINII